MIRCERRLVRMIVDEFPDLPFIVERSDGGSVMARCWQELAFGRLESSLEDAIQDGANSAAALKHGSDHCLPAFGLQRGEELVWIEWMRSLRQGVIRVLSMLLGSQ